MVEFAALPQDLVAAIARVAAALPDTTPGSHVALAFDRDHFAFAAAVFAAWAKGHAVALPRNARRANVVPVLARQEVVLLAHDTGAGLGLDVPKLLARADAPLLQLPIPRLGPVTCHGLTTRAWTTTDVAHACADASMQMELTRGTKVWNGCSAGAPAGLVTGLLVPITLGCELVDDRAAAHTIVAPAHRLAEIARDFGPALRQVVAVDEHPTPATCDAFAARSVRTLSFGTLGEEDLDRGWEIEARVLSALGVSDAVAVVMPDSALRCCVAASHRSPTEIRNEVALDPRVELHCVPSLPRDADGQVDRAAVLRWFGRLPDGRLATRTLDLETLPNEGAAHRFRTTLPSTFFAFDGHFATYPVLSGAMQLHEVVMPCVRRVLGAAVEPAAFHDLKFLARIAPQDTIDVAITPAADRTTCDFTIACRDRKCSTGRIVLREGGREHAP